MFKSSLTTSGSKMFIPQLLRLKIWLEFIPKNFRLDVGLLLATSDLCCYLITIWVLFGNVTFSTSRFENTWHVQHVNKMQKA